MRNAASWPNKKTLMTVIESFPAIETADCHTLILGSMPGVASLARQQYYAHPRNAFWPIMMELLAIDATADYETRINILAANGFALWDVLKACIRPGSLDAAIETASIVPNDIATLLERQRGIRRIFFNGGTAARLYRRHVQPALGAVNDHIEYVALPSTSPANAGMRYVDKLQAWQAVLAH